MSDTRCEGSDKGYIFAGPRVVDTKKPLKNSNVLLDNHISGVIVSENPASPWYHATFLSFGTVVNDAEGQIIQEVALCETTDADGDSTWSVFWNPPKGPATYEFVQGTGKWEGISGKGKALGDVCARADDHAMPQWEFCWAIGVEAAASEDEAYTDSDTCLSFHGPHITRSTKELSNGYTLVVSSQSGVLLSDNPASVSPRNHATCFDRGTTIRKDGKTLGDVMLLEDQDPDGDVAWLIHVWWYGKGPGWYRFLGGTGKWKGIVGGGETLGMLAPRVDDHYMLKSQIRWRIDK